MKIPTCLNNAVKAFDPHSTVCTFVGVNNLVDSSSAWKNGEYQKCVAELAKAAVKWTAIGATFLGAQALMHSVRPVHADILLAQANMELQKKEKPGQSISLNTKQLLDHYAREKKHVKHWPEGGKTYITNCLESDSSVASASTEYLIKGAIDRNDAGFIRTAIKTCANAPVTTKSCEMIHDVASKSQSHLNKMASACRKSANAFCQSTRETKVDLAIKNDNWEDLIKTCVSLKIPSESCTNGLKTIEEKINNPSKYAWTMAKKIDVACKGDKNLQVCQIAHEQIVANTLKYGKWDEIMEVVNRKSNSPNKENILFIEDAANALIRELPHRKAPRIYALYDEIKHPFSHFGQPSIIVLALSMARNCINNPSSTSLNQARELINYVEKYRSDNKYYLWPNELTFQMDELNKKIAALPAVTASPRTIPFTERPLPVAFKFDCTHFALADKLAIYMLGRDGVLALENASRHPINQLTEAQVDWESCGL